MSFFGQLAERLGGLHGQANVGLVSWLPLAGQFMNTDFDIVGHPAPPKGESNNAIPRAADINYFHVMRIPLIRGRVFDSADRLQNGYKAILSESLVAKYFGQEDPLGKHISFWNKGWEIIGIVGDVRKNIDEVPEPTVYIPTASGYLNFAAIVVRTSGDL